MVTNEVFNVKQKLSYDVEVYPFHKVIASLIEKSEESLEDLSFENDLTQQNEDFSFYKNMEQSPLFKNFYDRLQSKQGVEFYNLYHKFIKEVIRKQFEEPIFYQTKPSHRILFKDINGQTRYHKDSDYGHDRQEINYWLPQTEAFDTNTIWLETREDAKDYQPVHLKIGEYMRFPGAILSHGAHHNTTGKTRVSFDFRVIPSSIASEDLRNSKPTSDDAKNNPVMSNARKFSYCE